MTSLKFTGRYQILRNNKASPDTDLSYTIDNVIDLNNGTYFTLSPGESTEFVLDIQANCILVTSDNAVTVATDTNSTSGVANFTVDSATDTLSTSAKDIFPYTTQTLTLTTTDTLPAPLTTGTTYYVISRGPNELMLATSSVNALSGTQIDITDTGSGVHTLDLESSYTQCIDDYTQSTITLFTGANAQRVTIKNTSAVQTAGQFYAARASS